MFARVSTSSPYSAHELTKIRYLMTVKIVRELHVQQIASSNKS